MCAYYETPTRANVEFLKSAGGKAGRTIRLNHNPNAVPPQLQGRVDPVRGTQPPHTNPLINTTGSQELWASFMADVEAVANRHPYVVKPGAGRVAGWGGCMAVGAVLGFCCINPDGGDYGVWVPEVQQVLDRWRPTFQQRGCTLTFVQQRCVAMMMIVVDRDTTVFHTATATSPSTSTPTRPCSSKRPEKHGGGGVSYIVWLFVVATRFCVI